MKRLLLCLFAIVATLSANAQLMRAEELENYAKERYGDKWKDAAANLAQNLELDKNNSLTFVEVIEAPGKSKLDLYVLLNYWYTATFNDANSVIKLNDKDAGVIIANGYVAGVAEHAAGMNSYMVNIKPIIKTDIKAGKVRVTYTIQGYEVEVGAGGGVTAALMGVRSVKSTLETWAIEKCYPFVEKDKHMKTSSKALVMAHAYSNVIMDKIKETIQNGLTGNENDDW